MSTQFPRFKKHHKKKRHVNTFETVDSKKEIHNLMKKHAFAEKDFQSKEENKTAHVNSKKRKRPAVSISPPLNDKSDLTSKESTKKIRLENNCGGLSQTHKVNKKLLKVDASNVVNVANHQKTDRKESLETKKTISISSNVDGGNSAPLTVSAIKKKCLPKKTEDFSQNWKAFLEARAERHKHTQKKFFKKPKSNYPVKTSEEQPEVWFDDVDDILLDEPADSIADDRGHNSTSLVKPNSFAGLTKVVAMDCEMVGVGLNGRDSIVARVSLVNQFGQCIYDKYVAPTEKVTDYRTAVSGIRAKDIAEGVPFKTVQKEVSDILEGRILVGHAVHHDLKVLFLSHPRHYTRDTSDFKPFRKVLGGGTPSLKRLSEKLLHVRVQEGEHNSVQDAQAAMRLYTMHRKEWESSLKFKRKRPPKRKKVKGS